MNNKIFAKEIVRVITLLLSGFAIAYFALCFMVPQFNSNSSSPDKSEKMIVHQFDQDILLEYHTLHNGRTETIVNLFLSEKENAAASYVLPGEFVKPEINLIYHEDGLECYEWLSKSTCVITYKYEDSKVKAYPPIIPNDSDYNLLYPALKQEFMTKDWRRMRMSQTPWNFKSIEMLRISPDIRLRQFWYGFRRVFQAHERALRATVESAYSL